MARVEQMALATPSLLARIQLLPAERMLAQVDPGYAFAGVTGGSFDTVMNNGSMKFSNHHTDAPAGVLYGDALADVYYEAPPVKEFRQNSLSSKKLWWDEIPFGRADPNRPAKFGGKQKKPRIAIVELKQPFAGGPGDFAPLAEFFTSEGYQTEVVSPEQLEYRNGVPCGAAISRSGLSYYRRVRLQEFLVRASIFRIPWCQAYKDTPAVVNSFRAEVGAKRAIFDLLTDDAITEKFPAIERRAIKEHVPWTRLVQAAKTTHKGHVVDLPDFVMKHRAKLILKPNDRFARSAFFPEFRKRTISVGKKRFAGRCELRTWSRKSRIRRRWCSR